MEQARMSIGAVARMTGINASTLRVWERRYELGPTKRGAGGQREYSSADVDHLRLVKKLVDNGLRIGDIARLPTKALYSLLLESGESVSPQDSFTPPLKTTIVGVPLCHYFKNHIKRYPRLALMLHETDASTWLMEGGHEDTDVLILQLSAINRKHFESLVAVANKKIHVIVLYIFSQKEFVQQLEKQGVTLIAGGIDPSRIDTAVNKTISLANNLSVLDKSAKTFDVSMPDNQPRQFDEQQLVEAEAASNKLNCECPGHLTDLIRRLDAFEEYSQTCGAENWKQAAVHACVYSYANQARYLMEKALRTVLDE